MNKKIIFIFLCLILATQLFSDDLNEYTFIKIKVIPSGQNEGMIGWQPAIAGGFSGPTAIAISDKEIIYVPDRVNQRKNTYDLNLNYTKTVVEKGKKECHFALELKIDNNGNIIALLIGRGLKKINEKGETLFFIKWQDLPNNGNNRYNFFPLNNEIFLYNNKGKIQSIENTGTIHDPKNATEHLQKLSIEKEKKLQLMEKYNIPSEIEQNLKKLRNESSSLLIDAEFYSSDFIQTKKFFDKIKDLRDLVKVQKDKTRSNSPKEINIKLDDYNLFLVGYDKEHNSYWHAINDESPTLKNYSIIIFSKFGELLDAFYYGQSVADEKGN